MKRTIALLFSVAFIFGVSNVNADDKSTAMDANWTCTTNASTSATDTEKDADKQMSDAKSATEAFAFASANCRDCTKITCETK